MDGVWRTRGFFRPGPVNGAAARRDVIYACGDYRVDAARFEVCRAGHALAAEPQVLELLILLIELRERVVSRDELLDTIWKGRVVSDTTLSSRIKSARRLIGDDGRRQACIKTIHGRGFRFVGEVAVDGGAPALPPVAESIDRPPTHYARSGDIHVAYQLFGQGSVNLVLAPGFVSHIDNYWDSPDVSRWLLRLGRLARVAMFDKRGTGMSDRVDALPGMDERMDDLRAVIDAAGFDSAIVMGVSEGGSLAALFAAHHPARCDGLVLYGSFARFTHWFVDDAALQTLFDYIESDWGSGKSLPLFAPTVGDNPAFTRWWGQFERLGATPGAAVALMQMNSRIDICAVLASIQVPALVIHVAGDVLIDVAAGRELAAGIPGAKYVELDGVDHLPWSPANADRVLDAVADFIVRPRRRQASIRVLATIVLIQPDPLAGTGWAAAELAAIRVTLDRFRATRIDAGPQGLVATFDGPARALECAVSVSALLRRRSAGHRIGVHTGEVEVVAGAAAGTALAIASDVAVRAAHDEILVSRTVTDLVAGSSVTLTDRGPFALPSIDQTWHLYRVDP